MISFKINVHNLKIRVIFFGVEIVSFTICSTQFKCHVATILKHHVTTSLYLLNNRNNNLSDV